MIARDGRETPIDDSSAPICDNQGRIRGSFWSFGTSPSGEKPNGRLEERAQLSDFFENAAVGLHWVGPDGVILRVNAAELSMLGYSRDEYVGRHISEFHVEQDVIANILRRLNAGETLGDCPARVALQRRLDQASAYRYERALG